MTAVRSQLARYQPDPPADDAKLRQMAKAAWRDRGWLVLRVDDLPQFDREVATALGNTYHGRRTP